MTGTYLLTLLEAALCLLWMILCGFSIFSMIGAFVQRLPVKTRAVIIAQFLFEYLIFQDITNRGPFNERDFPGGPYAVLAFFFALFFFLAAAAVLIFRQALIWEDSHISARSIGQFMDLLTVGTAFTDAGGKVLVINDCMQKLAVRITGHRLRDGSRFWEKLTAEAYPFVYFQSRPYPILGLEEGEAWSFERRSLEVRGEPVLELIAVDVSDELQLLEKLEGENRALSEMNARLRTYGKNAEELTRSQEILAAKVRIHDDLGRVLLTTRQMLAEPSGTEERAALLALWRRTLRLLEGKEQRPEGGEDELQDLIRAAEGIGAAIRISGTLPPEGSPQRKVVIAALHECLTNTIRHAGGSVVEAFLRNDGGFYRFSCTNDGNVPDGPLTEGGGLSNLRAMVERIGGTMHVYSEPRFFLAIELPEEYVPGMGFGETPEPEPQRSGPRV